MKHKSKRSIPAKYILMILTILCVVIMFVSFIFNLKGGPLNTIAGYVFIPMQQGINTIGDWSSDKAENLKSLRTALKENKELKERVEELNTELSSLKLEKYKKEEWLKLYEQEEKASKYKTVFAQVILNTGGNWLDSFAINKGSKDGIEVGMNVKSFGGLVGRVVDVGPNYAHVETIIQDTSNVSAMTTSTSDRFIVTGNLQSINEDRVIQFTGLKCKEGEIVPGEEVVTSYISPYYLPDLIIGHIQNIEKDANNLTYSGTITPTVDFEHLRFVSVILEKKQQIK